MFSYQTLSYDYLPVTKCLSVTLWLLVTGYERMYRKWSGENITSTLPSVQRVKSLLELPLYPRSDISLVKEMATHSNVPAWRIPGTGQPGGLPSMGSHWVGHNWSDLAAASCLPASASALYCPSSTQQLLLFSCSVASDSVTPWTSAFQASLSRYLLRV